MFSELCYKKVKNGDVSIAPQSTVQFASVPQYVLFVHMCLVGCCICSHWSCCVCEGYRIHRWYFCDGWIHRMWSVSSSDCLHWHRRYRSSPPSHTVLCILLWCAGAGCLIKILSTGRLSVAEVTFKGHLMLMALFNCPDTISSVTVLSHQTYPCSTDCC